MDIGDVVKVVLIIFIGVPVVGSVIAIIRSIIKRRRK